MSNNNQAIRAARLLERQRRNNPWSEPAVTERRATDAEILTDARAKLDRLVSPKWLSDPAGFDVV